MLGLGLGLGLCLGLRLRPRLWDALPTGPQGKLELSARRRIQAQAALERQAELHLLLPGSPGPGSEPVRARRSWKSRISRGGGREVEDGAGRGENLPHRVKAAMVVPQSRGSDSPPNSGLVAPPVR